MRIIPILLLLSFSYSLFGQNNFIKELNQIISDTANHFQKFKGSVRETTDTESTYYNSLITIEGTKENWIINHRSICSYNATVVDSVTKNKGRNFLDMWKLKLMSALGTGYKIEKSKPRMDSQFIDGWYFEKGNFSVSINLSQYFYDKSLYGVRLFISNEHPRPR